ncbi:MAG: hypothetical protein WEA04_00755 [Candidatus Andersenbacteria bacterium]
MATTMVRIGCVDPRNQKIFADLEPAYHFTILGGSLSFVTMTAVQQGLIEQIKALHSVVELEEVHLEDHWDSTHSGHGCKAYNALLADDSQDVHEWHLRKAQQILQSTPGLENMTIRLFLRDLDHNTVVEIPTTSPALAELAA